MSPGGLLATKTLAYFKHTTQPYGDREVIYFTFAKPKLLAKNHDLICRSIRYYVN